MMGRARFIFFGAMLAAGILVADRVAPGPAPLVVSAAVATLAAIWALWFWLRTDRTKMPVQLWAVLCLACICIGFVDAGSGLRRLSRSELLGLANHAGAVTGTVAQDPSTARNGMNLALKDIRLHGRLVPGNVAVSVRGRRKIDFGARVIISGRFSSLDPRDVYDANLLHRGVLLRASTSASAIEILHLSRNPVVRAANSFRARMELASITALGKTDGPLLMGVVMGDDRQVPSGVIEDFRATGLSHLTAVSGANLAMLLAALVTMLRLFRVPRRVEVFASLVAIALFTVLTRAEPSVVRAWLMASLTLIAFLLGRRNEALHALGLSFFVLLVVDPTLIWSIGFQLSFAATLGILVLSKPIVEKASRLPRPIAEALGVGLAAQAAVTPLIAWHFGRVSLVSVPANLAAFALVAPATVLGLGGGVASITSPAMRFALVPAGAFTAALRAVAHLFASIPFATKDLKWNLSQMLIAYLLIGGAALAIAGRSRTARVPVALAVTLMVASSVLPAFGQPGPPVGLRVTIIDVGQGESTLIESPGGARVLIDGGPDPSYVSSFLARRGIDRLDLVVASHDHKDHVAGLQKVVTAIRVREFFDPGIPTAFQRRFAAVHEVASPVEGEALTIGDIDIEVLGPRDDFAQVAKDEQGASGENNGVNDASLVLRVGFGDSCVLFTGDIEEPAQEALLTDHPDRIRCQVLKAPHHGSAHLLESFVKAVEPDLVPVSVGPNDYGMPTRKALDIFQRSGARVARTDVLGDVVFELSPSGTIGFP